MSAIHRQLEIPEDIVRLVLTFVGDDVATVQSLCLVSRDFLHPCRDWLLRTTVIDFRAPKETLTTKALALGSMLQANPQYRSSIRNLQLMDNGPSELFPSELRDVTSGEVPAAPFSQGYNPDEIERAEKLFYFPDDSKFSDMISMLSNIQSLCLSFIHLICFWEYLSPLPLDPLTRMCRSDVLQNLHLEGVLDMPFLAFLSFNSLRNLHLSRCTLDKRDDESFRILLSYSQSHGIDFIPSTYDKYHRRPNARLRSLVLEELEGPNFVQLLTDYWLRDWGSATVDLLNPMSLTICHSSFDRDMKKIPSIVLRQAVNTLESLTLDTTGLATGLRLQSRYLREYEALANKTLSFMSYLSAIAFPRLSHLTLRISHWPIVGAPELNGELNWALNYLQDLLVTPGQPTAIDVIVNVVGERPGDALLNLSTLFRYSGWSLWDEALVDPKWGDQMKFSIMVCSQTGSSLGANGPHIHEKIASMFGLFGMSGRLNVTHRRQSRLR